MANGHGGARPGAGRPSKAVTHAAPVKRAEKAIADRLPELIDTLFARAAGVKVVGDDGVAYTQAPDRRAIEYLVNRVMGTPTTRHEVTGGKGSPIKVYVNLDPDQV